MRRFLVTAIFASVIRISSTAETGTVTSLRIWESCGDKKENVYLKAFIPEDSSKCRNAVIVCPGGSYFWLADKTEGEEVGRWLCDNGIAAFVLSYRVAGKFNFATDFRIRYKGRCYPAMLEDVHKALHLVRSRGEQLFGIRPKLIGVMGFSAGGHLALLSRELEAGTYAQIAESSTKMDFVALIYPVITMSDETIVHKRSRRGLMGFNKKDTELREKLSLEKNIPADCCPVFIVNCLDDGTVDYRNSVVLDSALTAKVVPHEYHCFPCGGHGFGIKPICTKDSTYSWTGKFIAWISKL